MTTAAAAIPKYLNLDAMVSSRVTISAGRPAGLKTMFPAYQIGIGPETFSLKFFQSLAGEPAISKSRWPARSVYINIISCYGFNGKKLEPIWKAYYKE
jgi:hypothetical protein